MEPQAIPDTMLEAVRQFADPQQAHDFFVQIRWPNGVACPRMGCGSAHVAYLANHRRWYCNDCKQQFTAKLGTVFEDSSIGFDKWLPAIWLIASNRNGISSCELARALKVTQKTAWFMLHRVRHIMDYDSIEKLSGTVEVDETYIGGKARSFRRNPKTGKLMPTGPQANKTIVMGIVERKGKVRAFVIPSTKRKTLAPLIEKNVTPGATVYTDALPSYEKLDADYKHYVINHAIEYVNGQQHTHEQH
jgi:transposase-like protein